MNTLIQNQLKNVLVTLALLLILVGCGSQSSEKTNSSEMLDSDPANAEEPELEDGILVPKGVRENLGITFVKVERRSISETRRVPGSFELTPEARREYHSLLRGRISLHVKQFQEVEAGDLLYRLNSPQWRQIQHDAVEAEGEITMAEATHDVLVARRKEVDTLLEKVTERMNNLSSVGTRNAELEAEAMALKSSLPRIDAELAAQEAAVAESYGHYQSRLKILSSVTGISLEDMNHEENGVPSWMNITELEVRAGGSGTVEDLFVNDGGWLEEGTLALATINKDAVRFHAEAPQSDIGLYLDGQTAKIVPSQGSSLDIQGSVSGKLRLGLTAHQSQRTISLYVDPEGPIPSWARSGVSAFLEITLTENTTEHWAIPLSAVLQDGLEQVFYRRDPENRNRVLRVIADLGENDGRWVAVKSRLKEGDEVVLDGAYALKMSGAGAQAPEGYHFHADGTLHKNH